MTFPDFKILPGIDIVRGNHTVKLDLFFDLQCPYSKKFWDTIGEKLTKEWSQELHIKFHPICLSHHR